MTDIEALGNAVLRGKEITREEALALYAAPLEPLAKKADEIRARFCGNTFDLCAILNAKSGRCPENCKFCAQSARYATGAIPSSLPAGDLPMRKWKKSAKLRAPSARKPIFPFAFPAAC